jgi:DmsE family decaheme c-type cytochrome
MRTRGTRLSGDPGWNAPGNLCHPLKIGLLAGLVALVSLFGTETQAQLPSVPGATYLGAEVCKGCHADQATKLEHTLHGKLLGTNLARGDLQPRGCEACHGPGSKHLEDVTNPTLNIRFTKKSPLSATQKNAVCLQCHSKGNRILWQGSPHESRDLACVTCHSVHAGAQKALLKLVKPDSFDSKGYELNSVQYNLCGQCHQVRAMQFQRSSHMPLTEQGEGGKIVCTTCHNPHGTTTEKLIREASVNQLCTRCHADKRGPFLWQHPPVLENCLNCHQAHGSNNAPLLRVKPPRLCQQCHGASGHPSRPYWQAAHFVFNRACLNCHANIHGSNHPSGTFFTR